MQKKEDVNEEREFQIAMLKVQLKFESEISYLTTSMAVVVSFLVTIVVLSFSTINSSIPLETASYLEWNFHLMEVFLLIAFTFLFVAYSWTQHRRMPKELENLRKPKEPRKLEEKPKEEKIMIEKRMIVPERIRKSFTKRMWFNCWKLSVALFIFVWLYEFANQVVFTNFTSTLQTVSINWNLVLLRIPFLIIMSLFFALVLWILQLLSPDAMGAVFHMLGFEKEEKR